MQEIGPSKAIPAQSVTSQAADPAPLVEFADQQIACRIIGNTMGRVEKPSRQISGAALLVEISLELLFSPMVVSTWPSRPSTVTRAGAKHVDLYDATVTA